MLCSTMFPVMISRSQIILIIIVVTHINIVGGLELETPIIKYCVSAQWFTVNECNEFKEISNSTFTFGEVHKNHLNLPTSIQGVVLLCEATFPVRWIAQAATGQLHHNLNELTNRLDQNPFTKTKNFYAQISIHLQSDREISRIFRCEDYNNPGASAELFLNLPTIYPSWTSRSTNTSFFFVVDNSSGQDDRKISSASKTVIVPCVGNGLESIVKLIARPSQLKRQSLNDISEGCLGCICSANAEKHDDKYSNSCGHISQGQLKKAYDIKNDQFTRELHAEYKNYFTNKTYALSTMQAYMSKYRGSLEDCNGDGLLTCEDYARFQVLGRNCSYPVTDALRVKYMQSISGCIYDIGENFTIYDFPTDDYDRRLGIRLEGQASIFSSMFECSAGLRDSYLIQALDSAMKISATLRYVNKNDDSELPGIYCEPKDEDFNLTLSVGMCDSISECDLKWRSWNHATSDSPFNSLSHELNVAVLSGTNRSIPIYNQGYVLCSGAYFTANEPYRFISVTDYMFTGLDDQTHLFLKGFPQNSIISLKNLTNERLIANVLYSFECKISTFVLLPNVIFTVEYSGGQRFLSNVKPGVHLPGFRVEVTQRNSKNNPIASWALHILLTSNISNVSCYSPWISSPEWAHAQVSLQVEDDPTVQISGNQVMNGAIIGGSIGAFCLLVTIIALLLLRKYKYFHSQDRNLTVDEVNIFHFGSEGQLLTNKTDPVHHFAFSNDLKIANESLYIENILLGEGEFGVVRKGTLHGEGVAVKASKPSADVDYFLAFLKEVKVMAYIAEGENPNIVCFLGAYVERIQEKICFAVVELSPFGNLHSFLRKNSENYTQSPLPTTSGEKEDDNPSTEDNPRIQLNNLMFLNFCKQIANGMEFLSQKDVIHGDLATRNVLVFPRNVVKITDFGLSRKLYNCSNYIKKKNTRLPWRWMSIESLCYMEFSIPSDVWSFGVTAWEIFSLAQVPYSGISLTTSFIKQLESGYRLDKPTSMSEIIYDWMLKCWDKDQKARPSFSACKSFFINQESEASKYDNIYGAVSEPLT